MKSKSDKQDKTVIRIQKLIQEIIKESAGGGYIYRGEPGDYTKTSSGLYRQYVEEIDAEHIDIRVVQKEILKNAEEYTPEKDESEILSLLQHYGGTTNLIDFTTDYNIALFFACDGEFDKEGRIILKKKEAVKNQLREPRNPTERIIAQKSIFVEPPKGFVEPDEAISIPASLKQPILKHLRRHHGISAKTIYNDIHGFIRTQKIHQSAYTEFYLGLTCSDKGDYEGAIGHYGEVIRVNPYFAEAYYNRGVAKGELGRYEDAIADYDQAIRINPQLAEAYYNRGVTKDKLGLYKEAIADYDQAIRINPQFAEAYHNRGAIKDALGRHEDAIADFDQVIRINPQFAEAYNNRGTVKVKLGQRQEAIEDFDQAIRLNPQYAEAYINRGVAKCALGRYEDAIADYDQAIRLNPQLAEAYYNRGITYLCCGKWDKAREDLSKAKEMGLDIVSAFRNTYPNFKDFEKEFQIKLPADIKKLLSDGGG